MKTKTRKELERYWRKAVEDWRGSGVTLKQFAEKKGVTYKRLLVWKQRFEAQLGAGKVFKEKSEPVIEAALDFAPIRVVDEPSESFKQANTLAMLEIVLLCGRTVRFNNRCQPEYLSSVVSVLEGC